MESFMDKTAVLDRFLDPLTRCLTAPVAKAIVALRADPVIQARIDELAEKCTEGRLSDVEEQEYEAYVDAIDLVAILQDKAREALDKAEN